MMGLATIRKAVGAAAVALVSTGYAVLNADAFNVHAVTGSQWESVALAALGAFTAVYHLPNAVASKVAAAAAAATVAAPTVAARLEADPVVASLLSWAESAPSPIVADDAASTVDPPLDGLSV